MTVLDERPPSNRTGLPPLRPGRSHVARWRLASRLARREVRRRPGRAALVTLLVALPVMGMVLGSVVARTQARTWAERFEASAGRADLRVETWAASDPERDASDDRWDQLLPAGSTVERFGRVQAFARRGDEVRRMEFTDRDLSSPLQQGVVEVLDGVAPEAPDEVAIDRRTAERFGVGLGDVLTLDVPAGAWRVTSIVRDVDSFRSPLMVFGSFDWDRVALDARGGEALVDLPPGTSPLQVRKLVADLQPYGQVTARDVPLDEAGVPLDESSGATGDPSAGSMAWGWVAGALSLAVVGIIIASAFATSARRQLVTLGQLSASGADAPLLRRTLALQGTWTGLLGSGVGVVLGFVALAAGRDVLELIASRRLGAYEVAPADLVVIVVTGVLAATLAALVPARSTAKVPVMAALAGRRPLGVVPPRLVSGGVALFAGGVFLLVLAAAGSSGSPGSDGDLYAATAVLGGLCVLAGMCCTTPLAVDVVGRFGGRARGSWRLSARSLNRTRTRSAGVVTAIAAAGALAIAGSTALASSQVERAAPGAGTAIPADTVIVGSNQWPVAVEESGDSFDPPPYRPVPVADALRDRVVEITGGTATVRRAAVWDPAPADGSSEWSPTEGSINVDGQLIVADPVVLDMIGLSDADRARLADVGAMTLFDDGSGAAGDELMMSIDIQGEGRRTLRVIRPSDPFASQAGVWGTMVTEETARRLGLTLVDDAVVVRAGNDLTPAQLRRLEQLQQGMEPELLGVGAVFDVPPAQGDTMTTTSISLPWSPVSPVPAGPIQLAIAAAALLITLAVVTIGLLLSAAESRDERDVLVAIGATPRTIRMVAAQKALLLSLAGTALALPTGLLPITAVLRSIDDGGGRSMPMDVSWSTVVLLVLAVPVLAGALTLIGSSLAQLLRPVRMSTLHTD